MTSKNIQYEYTKSKMLNQNRINSYRPLLSAPVFILPHKCDYIFPFRSRLKKKEIKKENEVNFYDYKYPSIYFFIIHEYDIRFIIW